MYNISYSNNINVIKYNTNLKHGLLIAQQKKWNSGWNKDITHSIT